VVGGGGADDGGARCEEERATPVARRCNSVVFDGGVVVGPYPPPYQPWPPLVLRRSSYD